MIFNWFGCAISDSAILGKWGRKVKGQGHYHIIYGQKGGAIHDASGRILPH